MVLRNQIVIILIFVPRRWSSVLAHDHRHCVLGITLPPSDANNLFIAVAGLPSDVKKSVPFSLSNGVN
jgi:hypothetical protein